MRDDKGFVPSYRVKEEADKRIEVENARKADQERYQSDLAALNRRLDEMVAKSLQPQTVAAKVEPAAPVAKPDMFADPEGYEKWVLDRARSTPV
jgi:hypothetical protein